MLHRATIFILATAASPLAAAEATPAYAHAHTVLVTAGPVTVAALSADPRTNAPPSHFLLHDSLGNVVRMSTNDVHRSLHPPPAVGSGRQIPATTKGAIQSEDVRQRIVESKSGLETLQWFPVTPPVLAPYLSSLDDFGNTAVQPGGFFSTDPLSQMAQSGKYWLSGRGLREGFYQSLTTVWVSDAASGSSALQYYAADFLGKWAVFEAVSYTHLTLPTNREV